MNQQQLSNTVRVGDMRIAGTSRVEDVELTHEPITIKRGDMLFRVFVFSVWLFSALVVKWILIMVCVAAFIILALVGVFVAAISIFRPKVGKAYLKVLKKSWGCFGKKIRLQKCETGFKDDVKNSLLSRVVIRHPKWLKPLSVIIEVLAVVVVVVFVWAVLTSIKSLLALWALGTCNITKAESCALGAEVCSIDEAETDGFFEGIGRWFTEWGEIFEAVPDKFREYRAEDYDFSYISADSAADSADSSDSTGPGADESRAVAADILDPGCIVCAKSYAAQKAAGFFEKYEVRIVPFAIQDAENNYKFKNSEVAVRYILAAEEYRAGLGLTILDQIFTGRDADGISYLDLFNEDYSREEATATIEKWLREEGAHSKERAAIAGRAYSEEITAAMTKNREIVEKEIKVKGIPTLIYDGVRHTGMFKM